MPTRGAALLSLLLQTVTAQLSSSNVTVHEYKLDSPVSDIQWVGKDKKTVFVRTTKNVVYRSPDEGKLWERQNWKMEGADSNSDGGDDKSGILSFHVSPADSNKIFFRGSGKRHWITLDKGEKYMVTEEAFTIKEVKVHPTEPEWMMASHLTDGCKLSQRVDCSMDVYLTTDLGKTWKKIASYVAQFEWGPAQDGVLKPGIMKESIFLVTYDMKTGNQPFGVWSAKANFLRSDDLWKTNYALLPRGNRFLFLEKFLFVAVVNKHHENQVNLYVSADGGKVFNKARLPFQLTEHSYTILDTSEGSVFLHVNHGDFHTGYGNIYLSDAEGLRFALSLRNNKRDAQGRCDFEKLQGIEGIYITNELTNAEESEGADGGRPVKALLRTKITFDKGGKWQLIKPPTANDRGKEFACNPVDDPACSLHLHGVTDSWGPFYTSKNAIGLVMATGNVGHHLSDKEDEVHTFFSRDAGLNWQMVRAGSHIYEYGDHGAIIVIADDRQASKDIYWSADEALTWNELHFSNEGAEIENVVIEPMATSQVFLMYGSRGDAGVIFQVDFMALHAPQCKGVDQASEATSDYELWSPTDGRAGNTKCLMGHQVRYTRRRRASMCYNGEQYERVEFRKNCPCAEEDYECDFGYERSSDTGPCVAIMAVTTAPPEKCDGHYTVSNGYRLIAGDTCDPKTGVDHLPTVYRCPGFFGSSPSASGWWFLFMLIALVGGLYLVTVKGRADFSGSGEAFSGGGGKALGLVLGIAGAVVSIFSMVGSVVAPFIPTSVMNLFGSGAKYGRLPDSAMDDELDLGDDDEEAEELRDGDMYSYERPSLSTLPPREDPPPKPTPPKAEVGSLIGEDFTSPLSGKKGE